MKAKKLISLILCVIMVLSFALTGCASQQEAPEQKADTKPAEVKTDAAAEPEVLKIAMVAPMTGDNAQNGVRLERGAKMCIEDYESSGKLGNKTIQLDIYDDKNDTKEAVNIANKILAEGDYAFVYGPFSSGNGLAIAEIFDEEQMVLISPTVSHADFISEYNYTFRVGQLNYYEGIYIAKYCAQKWGAKKIAGIYVNTDWGVTMSGPFEQTCKDQGMEVVANESFISGQTKDFSSILTSIKNAGADTIYIMAMYEDTGKILRQIYELGYDFNIACSSSAYMTNTLEIAGEEALAGDNIKFFTTFTVDNPDPVIQDFRTRISEEYDMDIDQNTVRAYDAMNVGLAAIVRLGDQEITGEKLAQEIMNQRDYSGPSGAFTIQDDRNVERQFYVSVPVGATGFEFLEAPELE